MRLDMTARPGRRLTRAATSLALVGTALLAGCSGADLGAVGPHPTPRTSPHPSDALWSETGQATDVDGVPVPDVFVEFAPAAGGPSVTAVTDASGAYDVTLRPGLYSVTCTSLGGTCNPDGSTSDGALMLDPRDGASLDVVVTDDADPSPSPTDTDPQPDPQPEASSDQDQCLSGGFTVCGFVTKDGQPMRGVVVEAKFGLQNQTVTTNDHGAYGLHLQIPTATLLCVEDDVMLEQHLTCQATGGNGGPVTVDSSDAGRIVDFEIVPVG